MLRSFPVILLLLVRISSAQTNSLSFRPVAAEYSTALDRIVMISANPNQLHIYDPVSQSDTKVSLPAIPLSLSVNPDGLHAAVAHDLLVSYVNLSTGAVEKTFTTALLGPVVVLGTDWVYLVPTYEGPVASIKIATGTETDPNFINGSSGRLHSSGKAIYRTLKRDWCNRKV
jgi:chitinase